MRKVYAGFWKGYSKETSEKFKELYRNAGILIGNAAKGKVLDVGSAGVFNYSFRNIRELVTVDLFEIANKKIKVRHSHVVGDVRNLPFQEDKFDTIIAQFLFHHLAEDSLERTENSLRKAFFELKRVLKDNGEIIIVESFLPRPLELFEEMFYPMLLFFNKIVDFPRVRQYAVNSFLKKIDEAGFKRIESKKIEEGPYVSQFGRKFPSWATPVRVYFLRIKKK